MDTDLALALGLVIAVLSVPALVSAYSDSRAPYAPLVTLLIGGGLVLFAVVAHPGGYSFADIPHVFIGVVARFWP